jgi:AcrR family transcriptional regulator
VHSCSIIEDVIAERIVMKDQILDATDRIMARLGFRKMTMDDLAREAGISKRTIYLHFKSKEDVGLSSIGRVVEQVHLRLEQISTESRPPLDRLRAMLMERVMGRIEQIKDYYHSLDELFEVVRPAYMARRKFYFDREVQLIAGVLQEVAGGGTPDHSLEEEARSLVLATNAFLPYSLSVRELGEPDDIRRRLDAMVGLLIRGVAASRGNL